MDQEKVGCFLKELRLEKGLTQEQLAEKFNISNRSVSRWENGKNMPDISLLVELAGFYQVGMDELLDGERKPREEGQKAKENEMAAKMAGYANEQRSQLLLWVRRISLIGIVLMTLVLAIQTFTYEPGIGSFACYVLSLLAFVSMAVLGLHVNGILEKIAKRSKFITACKVLVLVLMVAVASFVMRMFMVFALVVWVESSPAEKISGIENYDKSYYLENYSGDLDTGMFVFPEKEFKPTEAEFASSLKTGFFDTDGYIILRAKYSEEDYWKEVERLSAIECTISFKEEVVTQQVKYDEESYALPAYVTVDGFDDIYEYALMDEKNCTITYVLLSYPNVFKLNEYRAYLKKDILKYEITDALNQFSIYAYSFDDGQSWIEYSDMESAY